MSDNTASADAKYNKYKTTDAKWQAIDVNKEGGASVVLIDFVPQKTEATKSCLRKQERFAACKIHQKFKSLITCGLCEKTFEKKTDFQTQMRSSIKNLRKAFTTHNMPRADIPVGSTTTDKFKFSRLYDRLPVCLFCEQFFPVEANIALIKNRTNGTKKKMPKVEASAPPVLQRSNDEVEKEIKHMRRFLKIVKKKLKTRQKFTMDEKALLATLLNDEETKRWNVVGPFNEYQDYCPSPPSLNLRKEKRNNNSRPSKVVERVGFCTMNQRIQKEMEHLRAQINEYLLRSDP